MAKKKTPRQATRLSSSKSRGKAKKKKVTKKKKIIRKKKAVKAKGEKAVGLVDHFFGHISVAAFKVKAPLRVGDMIHVKGHTTDFVQQIDSIQSNHQSIPLAKKGVEVGIKVKGKCRVGDTVFLAAKEQGVTPPPATKKSNSYSEKKFLSF